MDNKPNRRLEDSIDTNKHIRKMNLDRRKQNHERRAISFSIYKGPARRLTIDRRLKVNDRRMVAEEK